MHILRFIKTRLQKNRTKNVVPPMPSWEEIVTAMYGQGLDNRDADIVEVIYSKDRATRALILKNPKDFYQYSIEYICPFDEEEWTYTSHDENALPAMWIPFSGGYAVSIFDSKETAIRHLHTDAMYKQYFE